MTDAEEIAILKDQIVALSKENKELKEMFEIVCKRKIWLCMGNEKIRFS